MLFAPANPAGVVTRSCVLLITEIDEPATADADVVPNLTEFVPVSRVPVIVMTVPPESLPELGVTELIVGAGT